MNSVNELLMHLSIFLFVIGYACYLPIIWKPEIKNPKVSWIIWFTLRGITVLGVYRHLFGEPAVIGLLTLWIVFVVPLVRGNWYMTFLDQFCLAGAILAVCLWQMLADPLIGISMSLVVMCIGFIPTITFTWKNPQKENLLVWTLFWLSHLCLAMRAGDASVEELMELTVFFSIDTVMMFIIYFRRPGLSMES